MNSDIGVVLVGIFSGILLLWILVRREISRVSRPTEDTALIEWLKSMQKTIDTTNVSVQEAMRNSSDSMTQTLQHNSRELNERLDRASQVIGELRQHVGEMSEVGKGIRSLQEFLQSPKMRGALGEEVLSDMIRQVFPHQAFALQYTFRSGAKVDVVVKTDAGLLPIDSKFPMNSYRAMYKEDTPHGREKIKKTFISDVKKHIDDISKKYILPDENTMDFALMYIPSESVYYEFVTSHELSEYARKRRVYPVSPNTLYAHLQILLLSFAGTMLADKSREIMTLFASIQNDYSKTGDHLATLGKHITNAFNTMNSVSSAFTLLGQKIDHVKSLPKGKSGRLEKSGRE